MASNPNHSSQETTQVTVKVSDRRKQRLNEIAFELSEPGERVSASDVLREALEDYLQKYESDPTSCAPRERGGIRNGDDIEA